MALLGSGWGEVVNIWFEEGDVEWRLVGLFAAAENQRGGAVVVPICCVGFAAQD